MKKILVSIMLCLCLIGSASFYSMPVNAGSYNSVRYLTQYANSNYGYSKAELFDGTTITLEAEIRNGRYVCWTDCYLYGRYGEWSIVYKNLTMNQGYVLLNNGDYEVSVYVYLPNLS